MTLRNIHLVVGISSVVAFIATGAYLQNFLTEQQLENLVVRFLYRANHTYILFAGLVNVIAGLYLVRPQGRWRAACQLAGSILLLVAPIVLFCAFVIEPPEASLERWWTAAGVFAVFLGAMLHMPGRLSAAGQDRSMADRSEPSVQS